MEEYEKKHRDSLDTVNTLKGELQKYKDEQRDSLTKVKTLSDEVRSFLGILYKILINLDDSLSYQHTNFPFYRIEHKPNR